MTPQTAGTCCRGARCRLRKLEAPGFSMIFSRSGLVFLLAGLAATAAPRLTVADAKAFVDRAESELLKLNITDERAGWVHENFITDDTEILAANEDEKVIARTTELVEESKTFDRLQLPPDLRRKILLLKLSLAMPAPKDPKLRA